jgi:hypothetical protein
MLFTRRDIWDLENEGMAPDYARLCTGGRPQALDEYHRYASGA